MDSRTETKKKEQREVPGLYLEDIKFYCHFTPLNKFPLKLWKCVPLNAE